MANTYSALGRIILCQKYIVNQRQLTHCGSPQRCQLKMHGSSTRYVVYDASCSCPCLLRAIRWTRGQGETGFSVGAVPKALRIYWPTFTGEDPSRNEAPLSSCPSSWI